MTASPDAPLIAADAGPPTDLPGLADRLRAVLSGCAVGDALAVSSAADDDAPARGLTVSADAQQVLYAVDGLLEALEWAASGEGADETACQWLAQLRWLRTQDVPWPQSAPAPPSRWIDQHQVLHADRGHQGQALEALRSGEMGQVERPVLPQAADRSVMTRAVAYGLLPVGWRSLAPLSIDAAAITHGHPDAQAAAAGAAFTIQAAIVASGRGLERPLEAAVGAAVEALSRLTRPTAAVQGLLTAALESATDIRDAASAAPPPPLGRGDTAAQTLALAVWAAVAAERGGGAPAEIAARSVELAHRAAGDRPRSPAFLAAALVGARHGTSSVSPEALTRLDARPVVEEAAGRWLDLVGLSV